MRVASHVDVAHLLSSRANEFDSGNSRLVDGRTIYQYLLFVQPHLPIKTITPHRSSEPRLTFPKISSKELRACSLGFFAELLITDTESHIAAEIATWSFDRVLVEFICRVAAVEEITGSKPISTNVTSTVSFAELVDVFVSSVIHEFCRRQTGALRADDVPGNWQFLSARADGMLNWLGRPEFSQIPLTQEIACYWYPGWRRSLFIYDSPLDHLSELPLSLEVPFR